MFLLWSREPLQKTLAKIKHQGDCEGLSTVIEEYSCLWTIRPTDLQMISIFFSWSRDPLLKSNTRAIGYGYRNFEPQTIDQAPELAPSLQTITLRQRDDIEPRQVERVEPSLHGGSDATEDLPYRKVNAR
ncbi:hypothetical protein TNCV_403601 [Trichonephila clavipes]|nr:hypothetical protein TNCV_403601 [Trichonephila clavipes]